jgi:L-lactate dehydrogenase complex protein LldG
MVAATPSGQQLWSLFTAKAELVSAAVLRAGTSLAALDLLREAGSEFGHTASLAQHFPEIAGAAGQRIERGFHPPEVAAAAQLAVAETGSVVLDEPDGDRAACFLAERLWVLVDADQIVPSLEQALARIQALVAGGSHHAQLVTGPSRTADIERVLTVGVHGPRALVVVAVGELSA